MESVNYRRRQIVKAAQRYRKEPLSALHHHLDLNWLGEAYRRTNPKASPGVDGQSWSDYGKDLMNNLKDLENRAKSGSYKAPPVKRSYVPKNEKEKRPIGLPTIENKVLERGVAMILEEIYEEEFYDFSYGFRPRRSAHQALASLREQCVKKKVKWILEVDIRKFFEKVDHRKMMDLLRRRVRDGVINRLIGRWLKAGVWEKEKISYPETGTPQGGVISPILSNIYLHEVLDKWFMDELQNQIEGESFMIRFADDFVMGFDGLETAQAAQEAVIKRLADYGLEVNEEKTRLVAFERPSRYRRLPSDKPEGFDFLGFTVYWGKSRSGYNIPKVKTSKSRFSRALASITQWGWQHRHLRLHEQWKKLNEKLRGHDAYYGVTHNTLALRRLRGEVQKSWRKWLQRRNRGGHLSWQRFNALLRTYPLIPSKVYHHSA